MAAGNELADRTGRWTVGEASLWGGLGVQNQPHWHHVRFDEAVGFKEALAVGIQAVGEQSDAHEILFLRVHDGVAEKLVAEAAAAVFAMDDDVFEEDDEAALGGADREQQVDHPKDEAILPEDEDAAAIRLFEDETQTAHLLGAIGHEIGLMTEQVKEEVGELRQVFQR